MISVSTLSYRSPWTWAVPVCSIIGLTIIWLTDSNQNLFLLINDLGNSNSGTFFWANTTILGDTLVATAFLSFFLRKRPDVIWAFLITAVFAVLWVHGLKPLIDNPRPGAVLSSDVIHVIGVSLRGGSFPSGHTTTAFAVAGIISLLRVHPLLSIVALLLATMAGISRAAVGAHWPMDIFAGAFGGWLSAVMGVHLFHKLAHHKQRNNQWTQQIPGQNFFALGLFLVAITLFFYENGYPSSQIFQFTIAVVCIITTAYNVSPFSKNPATSI